jgi:hypothetical protein
MLRLNLLIVYKSNLMFNIITNNNVKVLLLTLRPLIKLNKALIKKMN